MEKTFQAQGRMWMGRAKLASCFENRASWAGQRDGGGHYPSGAVAFAPIAD